VFEFGFGVAGFDTEFDSTLRYHGLYCIALVTGNGHGGLFLIDAGDDQRLL
jgi:hypothetical protein